LQLNLLTERLRTAVYERIGKFPTWFIIVFLSVALGAVVALGVLGRLQRGQLTGVTADESGSVLPGVRIVAIELETGEVRTTVSSDQGEYRFTDLPLGRYRVKASLEGFGGAVVPDAQIKANDSARLDFTLEVEDLSGIPLGTTGPEFAIVPVFVATDRERSAGRMLDYGSGRNPGGALRLGRFNVSIPRDHKMGVVERPDIWTLWYADPTKHLVITSRRQLSYAKFYEDVRSIVGKATRKDAFVFVHGFNVTLENAVYRTAQIAYDLAFDGAPILYSWPSTASLSPIGYATDSNNSDWTVPHLRWFLEDVAARSGATRVHLIAHSMGNKALLNALEQMPRSRARKFAQIVLTAPDIDADTFVQLADAVRRSGQMTTLYASANDAALLASKKLQTYRRAGDTRDGVVIVPGIDTVDVSAVDTDLIGHFYYGDNTSVISDMFLLLSQGLPPAKRPRLRAAGIAPNKFWRFVP